MISYTHYLAEVDGGRSPNVPAPETAKRYWSLPDPATLRDVVLVARADEAHHRDVNHSSANEIPGLDGKYCPLSTARRASANLEKGSVNSVPVGVQH